MVRLPEEKERQTGNEEHRRTLRRRDPGSADGNVFRLRTEGYTYFEIAEKFGISESSARVVFFRVKEKIRKELEKEGYSI